MCKNMYSSQNLKLKPGIYLSMFCDQLFINNVGETFDSWHLYYVTRKLIKCLLGSKTNTLKMVGPKSA